MASWQWRGARVGSVYVHLDLYVLDPEKAGKVNEFVPAGGLSVEDLKWALGMVRDKFANSSSSLNLS